MDFFLLDAISIINFIGAFHGIILAIIIAKAKQGNRQANRILSILIFLFSLGMAGSAYFASGLYQVFPHIIMIFPPIIFTYGPLLYLYIKALTNDGFRLTAKHLLHFIPFAINTLYFIPFHLQGSTEKIAAVEEFLRHPTTVSYVVLVVRIIHAFIYIFFCIRLVQTHAGKVKESFSAVEKVNISWIRHLLVLFIVVWLVVLALYLFIPHSMEKEKLNFSIIYLLVSLSIFSIGYRGMSQPEIFSSVPNDAQYPGETKEKKYEKTGLGPEEAKSLLNRLLRFITSEKPYLEPELTLPQLAKALDIPLHHVSQVINEKLQQNFYKFINSYRVEEAKKRLSHYEIGKEKLIKIAFDVGFNSLSTFNRVFKELTGQSPSEFRKKQTA